MNPSPPRIPEIPPFKSKPSKDWQPAPIDNSNQEFQQLQLPIGANSEWMRRLKNADTTMHRSHDCIVTGSKTEANVVNADAEPLKIAPSWTNVAQRSESISSTSGANAPSSKKASIDDETKGKLYRSYKYPKIIIRSQTIIISFYLFRIKCALSFKI